MQELYLPVLSHYENDNGWTGSQGNMNFEIERPVEGKMRVVTWYGPFSRKYAREEAESSFDMTEGGIAAMRGWLLEQARQMEADPPRTMEECRAYYEAARRTPNDPQ